MGPKINARTGRDPVMCYIEPTRTRRSFQKLDLDPCRPEKCHTVNVLPGPDLDPSIIWKLDPNLAGRHKSDWTRLSHIISHELRKIKLFVLP